MEQLDLTDITGTTTITGPGADQLTIDGNHASRIFAVETGVKAAISDLTIANGSALAKPRRFWGGRRRSIMQEPCSVVDCWVKGIRRRAR